jgi:hypothetical protein
MRQPHVAAAVTVVLLLTLVGGLAAAAEAERNILVTACPPEKLESALLPREKFHPFPTASERGAWDALPPETRKHLIGRGEAALARPWSALPATLYLQYARVGDRRNYERPYFDRRDKLADLVLGECAEGKGRFIDEIVNGVWLLCEESSWCIPAHVGSSPDGRGLPDVTRPVVDLFAADTGALLAWTDYLLGSQLDRVTPLVRKRIARDVAERILNVNLSRNFGWMGFDTKGALNNWTPWINSNWLTAALLLEGDEAARRKAVARSMASLDLFLDRYPDDGGCDEGPGYWGHAGGSLFDCLELLRWASDGRIDVYEDRLVREIGKYIYRAHVAGDWYINFADAGAKQNVNGPLIWRYGQRIGDEGMMAFGAWNARQSGETTRRQLGRDLPALFHTKELRSKKAYAPLLRDVWLPDTGVMVARSGGGSSEGLYLAAQGGHNAESHNHNDVGNFVVFIDGEPALIDVGVPTYTAKTFSARRYEIWAMQSGYHNCPTVNGVMQSAGRKFEAREVARRAEEDVAELGMEIAAAYPAEAKVKSWRRIHRLNRPGDRGDAHSVEIIDRYALDGPGEQITLSLMTPCKVTPGGRGVLVLAAEGGDGRRGIVEFDAEKLKPVIETVPTEDARLQSVWGDRVYRILLRQERPPETGEYRVTIRG